MPPSASEDRYGERVTSSTLPARALRWLSVAATIGMLLVLIMGAAVTNTGSAEGCGRSWPMCNGQFIPEFTVATAIEYSHRVVSGIEGMLILALAVVMLARWRTDREVVMLAPLMLGALLLQAGLGAAAVVMPQSPAVLASHFGVSLLAFASTFLSAVKVFERTRPAAHHQAAPLRSPPPGTPPPKAPAGLAPPTIGVALYVMLVVYLGAYVRHAGVSLACADWPLCDGQLVPPLAAATGIVFAHRVAAIGVMVLLAWLATRAQAAGMAPRIAWLAFGLSVAQALSGAFVVTSRLSLFSTLGHAALMALLFAALALLLRRVLTTTVSTAPTAIATAEPGPSPVGYAYDETFVKPASARTRG